MLPSWDPHGHTEKQYNGEDTGPAVNGYTRAKAR